MGIIGDIMTNWETDLVNMHLQKKHRKTKKKTLTKGKYVVQKKSIYTNNRWVKVSIHSTVMSADAKAEFVKRQKYIMGKDWTGTKRPSPKTYVRIVKI